MAERTIGMLPISVGSSLPFENLMTGTKRRRIQMLMLNLSTIIRNAYQAYETKDRGTVDAPKLYQDVMQDLSGIYDVRNQIGTDRPEFVVYNCDYTKLASKYKHAKLWSPSTDAQRAYAVLVKETTKSVIAALKDHVVITDCELPKPINNTYVITHHIVDLVNANRSDVILLESHTGACKDSSLWHTKLTNGKNLDRIPFNQVSLQVFGDNSTDFKTNSLRVRSALLSIAEKHQWTAMTTLERVRLGIGMLEDRELRAVLQQMLSV